jgi:hypothetical protein
MNELTTSIVGIDFPNEDKSKSKRLMECMICAPGELVELRLEPKNPFDENAVAIWSERGVQLGYVSAEHASLIGKRMGRDKVVAVFQAMHGTGAYIRIRFGGGLPTLPDPVPDVPKRPSPRQMRLAPTTGVRSPRFLPQRGRARIRYIKCNVNRSYSKTCARMAQTRMEIGSAITTPRAALICLLLTSVCR